MKRTVAISALLGLTVASLAAGADEVADLEKQLAAARARATAAAPAAPPTSAGDVAAHLQDVSVTIVADTGRGKAEGSGVIVTRRRGDESINFVWTAAHVVDGLRHVREVVDGRTGTKKTAVEFRDARAVKELVEAGRAVGKTEMLAEVVRFSAEEDLALLRLRKKNFVSAGARFYLDDAIPPIGTELIHVGSLLGQMGSNSMTRGIMSQHGRLIDEKVYDQTTVAAFEGSSGGGVFLADGRLVGQELRGAGETFNLIAPVRRIRAWAKSSGIEWAVDDRVPLPSDEELRKLPVEDAGVTFGPAASGAPAKPPAAALDFPPLVRRSQVEHGR